MGGKIRGIGTPIAIWLPGFFKDVGRTCQDSRIYFAHNSYSHILTHTHIYIYTYRHIYIYTCVHVCGDDMYIYIIIYIQICICICIYMHVCVIIRGFSHATHPS